MPALIRDAEAWLMSDSNRQRGEFVVLVSGAKPQHGLHAEAKRALELLLKELSLKQAVQFAAQVSVAGRNELYQLALQIKKAE